MLWISGPLVRSMQDAEPYSSVSRSPGHSAENNQAQDERIRNAQKYGISSIPPLILLSPARDERMIGVSGKRATEA